MTLQWFITISRETSATTSNVQQCWWCEKALRSEALSVVVFENIAVMNFVIFTEYFLSVNERILYWRGKKKQTKKKQSPEKPV